MKSSLYLFAQQISAGQAGIPTGNADSVLANGLNLIYFLGGVAAVIVIIVAGVMYAISAGDAGRLTRAKNLLTYAIVGLIVMVSAFAITQFVIGRFQ